MKSRQKIEPISRKNLVNSQEMNFLQAKSIFYAVTWKRLKWFEKCTLDPFNEPGFWSPEYIDNT